jgi:hypothetical protein
MGTLDHDLGHVDAPPVVGPGRARFRGGALRWARSFGFGRTSRPAAFIPLSTRFWLTIRPST